MAQVPLLFRARAGMKTAAQRFSQLRSIPPMGIRSRRFSVGQVQCKKQQPSNGSFKARESAGMMIQPFEFGWSGPATSDN